MRIWGNFKNIASGFHHSLATDENGVLHSWGRNTFGQLGQSEFSSKLSAENLIGGINTSIPNPVLGVLNRVQISEISCGW